MWKMVLNASKIIVEFQIKYAEDININFHLSYDKWFIVGLYCYF